MIVIDINTVHSIKNILIGLKGGSYLLRKTIQSGDKDKLEIALEMVERNIRQISKLVHEMLICFRTHFPQYEMCSLNEIVEKVCKLMSPQAEKSGIQIVQVLDPSVQKTLLDPKGIHCCITNLLSNAMDACLEERNTSKFLRIEVRTFDDQNGKVGFTVSDNGSGMSEAVQKKIFTNFFSTKGVKGTGIGLALTYKIVKEHGGTIYLKSRLGEGSMFTIELPKRDCGNNTVLPTGTKKTTPKILGGIHEKSFNH